MFCVVLFINGFSEEFFLIVISGELIWIVNDSIKKYVYIVCYICCFKLNLLVILFFEEIILLEGIVKDWLKILKKIILYK